MSLTSPQVGFGDQKNAPSESELEGSSSTSSQNAHREVHAAKISIDRAGHGVTMTITAGKLRLRLYIEAQWSDLIQKTSSGEGELNQLVPFRMAPFEIEGTENVISARTVEARALPGLSEENPPIRNAASGRNLSTRRAA